MEKDLFYTSRKLDVERLEREVERASYLDASVHMHWAGLG